MSDAPQNDQFILIKLLSVLVLSKTALRHHRPQIQADFWQSAGHLRVIAETVLDLYDKIQAPPSKATLLHELLVVQAVKPQSVYDELVRSIYSSSVKEAMGYYEEKLLDQIKAVAYQHALDNSMALYQKGEYDEIDRLWLMASSATYGEPVVETDVSDSDIDTLLDDDAAAYGREKIMPTGFPSYDTACKGGIAAGELHLVVAPPNVGKSRWMLNTGANMAGYGGKILYVSMEMGAGVVRDRYWQCITDQTVEELRTERGRAKVKDALARIKAKGGLFHIVKFDEFSMSFRKLESYIRAQQTEYDCIITDYMDLFEMESHRSGNYFVDQGFMYHEGRRMGRRLGVGHLSACQPVDGAGQIIALRAASGGKGKGAAVDIMTSLNASEADEVAGKQTQFVGKNRIGPRNMAWGLVVNRTTGVVRESGNGTSSLPTNEDQYNDSLA